MSSLLSSPRNQVRWSLRARDIALRAKGSSFLRHQHQQRWSRVSEVIVRKGGRTSSGSALLADTRLAKRSLEHETDMTDASVEQGERKRCKEHPTVPEPADSSGSSSESSTHTEKGLVDLCTILSENNPETEGCCRGGPATLELTMWDFNKADCRTRFRKLVEIWKPLLLSGSPIVSGGGDKEQARAVLHLAFICELYETQVRRGRYFLHTHSHSADSWDQATMVGFLNRFPGTLLTVTDSCLLGPKNPGKGLKTLTGWLTNSGCIAQALNTPTHLPSMCQTIMKAMHQQLQSDFCVVAATEQPQHRPPLPKLDFFAVDAFAEPRVEWEAEDDVKGGPLDPQEVKTARQKVIQCVWDREVYEYATEAASRTRTGRNPVGLKWIDTNEGRTDVPRYRSRLVCTEVRHKGVEAIFSPTPPLEALRVLLCVACQEDVFRVEDPFLIAGADVSRAHFYADAVRDICVRLPDEDPKAKEPGV